MKKKSQPKTDNEIKPPKYSMDDFEVCNCGRVWHLEKMKHSQYEWNRFRQIAKCSCGIILSEEKP